ncbi:GyrI-like domain-containing protein [Intrasporangium flavum]|uniref:GyrI-like domain-containing protein n=1 Tax=Intrasporangium flavum TaxID=1428657 RepID=UPI00096ED7A8|nr:GyrI-like domain-containing protein [Intrasporangium flavum]
MSDIHVVRTTAQHTAVVRAQVPVQDLPAFFERAYGEVLAAVRAHRAVPVGPPFALYHGMPGATVDLEAGFPVSTEVPASGEVVPGTLPAGEAVEAVHVGPYDRLRDTYADVERWMAEHHLTPAAQMWESYLSDPQREPDPAGWRTLVVVPTA